MNAEHATACATTRGPWLTAHTNAALDTYAKRLNTVTRYRFAKIARTARSEHGKPAADPRVLRWQVEVVGGLLLAEIAKAEERLGRSA